MRADCAETVAKQISIGKPPWRGCPGLQDWPQGHKEETACLYKPESCPAKGGQLLSSGLQTAYP